MFSLLFLLLLLETIIAKPLPQNSVDSDILSLDGITNTVLPGDSIDLFHNQITPASDSPVNLNPDGQNTSPTIKDVYQIVSDSVAQTNQNPNSQGQSPIILDVNHSISDSGPQINPVADLQKTSLLNTGTQTASQDLENSHCKDLHTGVVFNRGLDDTCETQMESNIESGISGSAGNDGDVRKRPDASAEHHQQAHPDAPATTTTGSKTGCDPNTDFQEHVCCDGKEGKIIKYRNYGFVYGWIRGCRRCMLSSISAFLPRMTFTLFLIFFLLQYREREKSV